MPIFEIHEYRSDWLFAKRRLFYKRDTGWNERIPLIGTELHLPTIGCKCWLSPVSFAWRFCFAERGHREIGFGNHQLANSTSKTSLV